MSAHTPGSPARLDSCDAIKTDLMKGGGSFKPGNMSAAQQRALLNLAAGHVSDHGLSGRSEFGAHGGVLRSLAKFGFVALRYGSGPAITDVGLIAAAAIAKATGSTS